MSEDRSGRRTPPENEEDWFFIWDSSDKSQKAWRVVGPLHSIVSNWKAYLVIAGIILAINSPRIVETLEIWVAK